MPTIKERAIHIQQLLDRMPVWKKIVDDKAVVTGADEAADVQGGDKDKNRGGLENVASDDDNKSSKSKTGDETEVAEDLEKVGLKENDDGSEESDSKDGADEDHDQYTENRAADLQPKCPICLNLEPGQTFKWVDYEKWKPKGQANLGCPTCPVIEDAMSKLVSYNKALFESRGGTLKVDSVSLSAVENDKSLELELLLMIETDVETWHTAVMKLYIHEGQPTPYTDLPIFMLEGASMPKRLKRVRAWIDDCVSNHEACRNHEPLSVLPRRVLDIRRFSETGLVNLVESSGMRGMYACLSYCWGTDNDFVTTFDNLDAMMIGIPWAKLPQTYKDAVVVASELNIPFLWVDALCIIQGQKNRPETLKDWEEQSAMMSSIYGQAYLTIAATNCSAVHEGFLGKCRLEKVSLKASFRREGSSVPVCLYGRRIYDHKAFEPRLSDIIVSLLNFLRSRAWCFQEHCLSTRVLSFGNDEIVFDCNSRSRCECGDYTEQEVKKAGRSLKNKDARWVISHGELNTWGWSQILKEYVDRSITFPGDKLPAISGIARMFQEKRNVGYLAGHWDDSELILSLSWSLGREMPPEQQVMPYRAPSWSWAAISSNEIGQQTYWDFTRNPNAPPGSEEIMLFPDNTAIGKQCLLATNDPTGAVVAGYLIVRGFGLEAELKWDDSIGPQIWRNNIKLMGFAFDKAMAKENLDILCWYIGWRKIKRDGGTCFSTHSMMILQRTVNRVYRRIGWLWLTYDDVDVEDAVLGKKIAFLEGYEDCLTCFAII